MTRQARSEACQQGHQHATHIDALACDRAAGDDFLTALFAPQPEPERPTHCQHGVAFDEGQEACPACYDAYLAEEREFEDGLERASRAAWSARYEYDEESQRDLRLHEALSDF